MDPLDPMTKFFIALFATVVMLVAGYFIFKTDRVFDVIFPENSQSQAVKKIVTDFRDSVYEKIDPFLEPVRNIGKETVEGVVDKAKDQVDGLLNKAKEDALNSVKQSVNQKIDSIAGKPFSGGGQVVESPPAKLQESNENFPLGFSVKKGVPAIFIVKDLDNLALVYSVLWGDEKKDEGSVPAAGAKTLYHVWDRAGEYPIKLEIKQGDSVKNFSSYILVY